MKRTYGVTVRLAVWLLLALPLNSVQAGVQTDNINMFVGEVQVMENMDVQRVAVGNGKVLKVRTLPGRQLLLIAEAEGSTSVHLWFKDGTQNDLNIRISKVDPETRVRLEDMIYMDVKIVEFRKTALRELGIDWQSSIDGPVLATAGDFQNSTLFRGSTSNPIFQSLPNSVKPFQTYFGIATEVTSRINYLAENGDAYTLAEPKLSCKNGGSASFHAGGEVPIPIRGANGEVTVTYKDYGILLNIEPQADRNGIISAKIATEVSKLDRSIDVFGAPGFLTRTTETQMNVRENETIVISGLMNAESVNDAQKLPLLGDIPILGYLFKSKLFRNEVTELVVFVTPRIFKAESILNKQRLDKANTFRDEAAKRLGKALKYNILD